MKLLHKLHIMFHHDTNQFWERSLAWIPAEKRLGFGRVTQQLIHFTWTEILWIHLYKYLAGSHVNTLFINTFTFFPLAEGMALGVVYTLIGQVIVCFATIVYMLPALGCGPRDTLLVIIGRRFGRFPIGTVKFGMELLVLVLGVLMGAPFGLGTVLVMALQASIFQLVCRICRYEIRDVEHEDLIDTYRYLIKGGK